MEEKFMDVVARVSSAVESPSPSYATASSPLSMYMQPRFSTVALRMQVSEYPDEAVQMNAAVALYHIASHKRTQHLVVKKGTCVLPACPRLSPPLSSSLTHA
jgi:hypothetical protein